MNEVLAAVKRIVGEQGIVCASMFWVPGPGKAAESFPQPQAVQKVGHQLGCGEGMGRGWAESITSFLQFSQAVTSLFPYSCESVVAGSVGPPGFSEPCFLCRIGL